MSDESSLNNQSSAPSQLSVEELSLLHKADKVLVRCASELGNYSYINPLNRDAEFEKFSYSLARGETYSPKLEYLDFDPSPFIEELNDLVIPENSEIGRLFRRSRDDLLRVAEVYRLRGTDDFNTSHLFEPLEEETLAEARRILEIPLKDVTPAVKSVSSLELKEIIENEIRLYGLKGWRIIFDDTNASVVSIRGSAKLVKIRPDEFISKKRVQKLLVHEIGTHVLRARNGENQDFSSFVEGLPGYLLTEEGLASYNEWTQGLRSQQTARRQALRVLAMHIARTKGFMDVYSFVRPYLKSDASAFYFAVRTKRGLYDTSKSGGYLKDHLYLQGFLKVKSFVENGGSLRDLYAGKIRLADADLVRKGVLRSATVLPSFLSKDV